MRLLVRGRRRIRQYQTGRRRSHHPSRALGPRRRRLFRACQAPTHRRSLQFRIGHLHSQVGLRAYRASLLLIRLANRRPSLRWILRCPACQAVNRPNLLLQVIVLRRTLANRPLFLARHRQCHHRSQALSHRWRHRFRVLLAGSLRRGLLCQVGRLCSQVEGPLLRGSHRRCHHLSAA